MQSSCRLSSWVCLFVSMKEYQTCKLRRSLYNIWYFILIQKMINLEFSALSVGFIKHIPLLPCWKGTLYNTIQKHSAIISTCRQGKCSLRICTYIRHVLFVEWEKIHRKNPGSRWDFNLRLSEYWTPRVRVSWNSAEASRHCCLCGLSSSLLPRV